MALQTSGAISLADIAAEFGGAAPHSISEYYGDGNAPSGGAIDFADFYGASFYTYGATWIGGDTIGCSTYLCRGMETSGRNYRYIEGFAYGPWRTANTNNTFGGNSTHTNNFGFISGIYVSGNAIRFNDTAWSYNSIGSTRANFSGGVSGTTIGFVTSSGKIYFQSTESNGNFLYLK